MGRTSGTGGWWHGTSGGRRVWLAGCALVLGVVVLKMLANATSVVAAERRDDAGFPAWIGWALEGSSAIGWLAAMPLVVFAAVRLRPPRLSWPATLIVHAALTVPVSLIHVGVMVAIREVVFAAMNEPYRLASTVAEGLLYEWRKDVADYVLIALTFGAVDWLARRADEPRLAGPARVEVRDGTRTWWLDPADILWAQAAGNYVELHLGSRHILHRATLADLERLLGAGFARIHRSRLVSRSAVRRIETNPNGDFEVMLDDGATIAGSRRYRANLSA